MIILHCADCQKVRGFGSYRSICDCGGSLFAKWLLWWDIDARVDARGGEREDVEYVVEFCGKDIATFSDKKKAIAHAKKCQKDYNSRARTAEEILGLPPLNNNRVPFGAYTPDNP